MEIPKKPDINLIAFKDSQAAIDGTLEAWLPRLIESNEILVAALERIKKLHSSGEPVASKEVLLEINTQPGLTRTSLLPEQAAYRGMSFQQLCTWMVENAACRA